MCKLSKDYPSLLITLHFPKNEWKMKVNTSLSDGAFYMDNAHIIMKRRREIERNKEKEK